MATHLHKGLITLKADIINENSKAIHAEVSDVVKPGKVKIAHKVESNVDNIVVIHDNIAPLSGGVRVEHLSIAINNGIANVNTVNRKPSILESLDLPAADIFEAKDEASVLGESVIAIPAAKVVDKVESNVEV